MIDALTNGGDVFAKLPLIGLGERIGVNVHAAVQAIEIVDCLCLHSLRQDGGTTLGRAMMGKRDVLQLTDLILVLTSLRRG